MQYTTEVTIALPRDQVIAKLDNPDNMRHWQRGLIEYTNIGNIPAGQEGAQMKLEYKMGKRSIVMTETIVERNFPEAFHATYDAPGVHNIQRNYFHALEDGHTKWVSESEFRFEKIGMKLIGWLMPGAFKKQSLKYLNDFKAFAESGISVAESP
jgi:hypothetical protein